MNKSAVETIRDIIQQHYDATYTEGQRVVVEGHSGTIMSSFGMPWLLREEGGVLYRVVFDECYAKYIAEEKISIKEKSGQNPPKKNLPDDKEIQKWLEKVWDDPKFKEKHGPGWEGVAFAMAWDKFNAKSESCRPTREPISEMKKNRAAAWQMDPNSIETDKVQLWLASGSMETANLSKKKAQEYVRSGKAYVISAQAIGLYEAVDDQGYDDSAPGNPNNLDIDSEFVADVYAKQNAFFRDIYGISVNHFNRGKVYYAKKSSGEMDVVVETSLVPLPAFLDNFSFAPVWVDGNFTT